MKIRFFPADDGACGFYRHKEPARIAAKEGVEVEVNSDYSWYHLPRGRVLEPIEADVAVFQRPAKRSTVEMIEALRQQGVSIVVDLDDDLASLHVLHPFLDEFRQEDRNWGCALRCAAIADLVTVTTPALADKYAPHGRVAILPNCVPESLLDMPRKSDGQTLGWAGALQMHPGDLAAARGGVSEALQRTDWHFRAIGRPEGVGEALGIGAVEGTDWLDLPAWYEALGTLDVGIVPLGRTAFNEAKSALKGLEYAARGIPFVASELPEYVALSEEGAGLIAAEKTRHWVKWLVPLMQDTAYREQIAAQGREVIRERHTYERQGWRWLEAWNEARLVTA